MSTQQNTVTVGVGKEEIVAQVVSQQDTMVDYK